MSSYTLSFLLFNVRQRSCSCFADLFSPYFWTMHLHISKDGVMPLFSECSWRRNLSSSSLKHRLAFRFLIILWTLYASCSEGNWQNLLDLASLWAMWDASERIPPSSKHLHPSVAITFLCTVGDGVCTSNLMPTDCMASLIFLNSFPVYVKKRFSFSSLVCGTMYSLIYFR